MSLEPEKNMESDLSVPENTNEVQQITVLNPISWPCSPCELNKHDLCASLRLLKSKSSSLDWNEEKAKFHCSCYRENPERHEERKN